MSHEGIRIVSKEEAERERAPAQPLPRIAIAPEKVRVLLTEGNGLEIDWQDGHKSAWNFAWLRDACPCATCVDERIKEGRKIGQPNCCPCISRWRSPQARMPSAATRSSSTGSMDIPAGFIRGNTCDGTASARSASWPS